MRTDEVGRASLKLVRQLVEGGLLKGYMFDHLATIPVSYTHLDVYKRQAWHLYYVLDLQNKETHRIAFHEITKSAIPVSYTHLDVYKRQALAYGEHDCTPYYIGSV